MNFAHLKLQNIEGHYHHLINNLNIILNLKINTFSLSVQIKFVFKYEI